MPLPLISPSPARLRVGCLAALLVFGSCTTQAATTPAEVTFPHNSKSARIDAAFPAPPSAIATHSHGEFQPVLWLSLTRRLQELVRRHFIPATLAVAIEKVIDALVEMIPRERIRVTVCASLLEIERFAHDSWIKPEARISIDELLVELKHLGGCA